MNSHIREYTHTLPAVRQAEQEKAQRAAQCLQASSMDLSTETSMKLYLMVNLEINSSFSTSTKPLPCKLSRESTGLSGSPHSCLQVDNLSHFLPRISA